MTLGFIKKWCNYWDYQCVYRNSSHCVDKHQHKNCGPRITKREKG